MVTKLYKIVEDKYKFLVRCSQSSIRRKEMKIAWKLYLFFYLCYAPDLVENLAINFNIAILPKEIFHNYTSIY